MGKALPMPHTRIPFSPPLALWGLLAAQREKRDSSHVQGTRAGSQAALTQAETPAQTSGPCLPHQAGIETHIGIRVANDKDNLHNKIVAPIAQSPQGHIPPCLLSRSSDSLGHVLL